MNQLKSMNASRCVFRQTSHAKVKTLKNNISAQKCCLQRYEYETNSTIDKQRQNATINQK